MAHEILALSFLTAPNTGNAMQVPAEFLRLGHCFLQDDYDWGIDDLEGWSREAIALSHLPPAKIEAVKTYLDEVLRSNDDDYIDKVLSSFGAGFGMRGGGGSRNFFTLLRKLLDVVEVKSVG
ncbi:MAG: hypothetical protein ACLPSW_26280 [Roseiarcus sp.]